MPLPPRFSRKNSTGKFGFEKSCQFDSTLSLWYQTGSETDHTTGTEGGYCLAVRRYLVLRPLLPS